MSGEGTTASGWSRRRRRLGWLALLVLIVASNLARWPQGHTARPLPHHRVAVLEAVDPDGQTVAGRVEMVYQDLGTEPDDRPVVLLLQGSPARSYDLQDLADGLARDFRVLAPELPGFGRSTRKIPDYGFRAHAAYLDAFLSGLGVTSLHVVAYSQGGGVALELQARRPDVIRSLAMVSSIGTQEHELLGNYAMNRAIHGVQLAFIRLVDTIIPHFGWLDTVMLDAAYARNFFDADMRPLRGILERYEGPMLVVHGADDVLVPPGAARETARIVPQSETVWHEGGHLLVFTDADRMAADVRDFIGSVEEGRAVTRATADPEREVAAARPFSADDVEPAAGLGLFVIVFLIAFSTFISEDLACIGAGLLATHGIISYPAAAFGAFAGIFVGDLLLYWAGYHWGRAALRRAPFRWFIKEAGIRESSKWFARKGPIVILTSRFVPGSRLPTYFTAGMLHTRFWQFFVYFFIAGVLWAPLLVWLAMTIGQEIIDTLFQYKLYTLGVIVATVLLLWLMFRIVIPMFSFKGRRLLFGRWRRIVRWEFWPPWIFYPPVIAHALYLGLRYRGLTLFTAANPAMPHGGLIGESKKEILDGFRERRDLLARYDLIPAAMDPAEKEASVIAFLDRNGLSFPVVLKPDCGQRGLGVAVIRNVDALRRYVETPRPSIIVQEYVPGFEFGVFYYRFPGQPRGHVYSITEKRFPSVVGDGRHDLEHLILKDPRAVCMAPFYFRVLDERRYTVPAEDEVVQLVEIGTHCRGAIFQDGRWIRTPELERAIDELSQGFEGFYFGRYDIRTPSLDALREGRGFKVIELNGVTAESTNIYDPGYGLFDAYTILFKQWRIAYKIGQRNRRLGVRPCTVAEFLQALADYDAAPEA